MCFTANLLHKQSFHSRTGNTYEEARIVESKTNKFTQHLFQGFSLFHTTTFLPNVEVWNFFILSHVSRSTRQLSNICECIPFADIRHPI